MLSGILEGRVLFFRDLGAQYYPDYSFVAGSLRQGVWPLWNPTLQCGAPWLLAYPVDLVLLLVGGAPLALGPGVVLHVAWAMLGADRLARELGQSPMAAFCAGAVFGLSGAMLSFVNLLPLLQGAAWLPWVVAALLRLVRTRSAPAVAALALALALQVSTLAVELVAQAFLAALFFVGWTALRRSLGRLLLSLVSAALLSAPVWIGAIELLRGTSRGAGFDPRSGLGFSVQPIMLLDLLLPRFFGNVHSFAGASFWGRGFFPEGFPYLLSLYLGAPVLTLAARGANLRLGGLCVTGVCLALGSEGPLRLPLLLWAAHFRAPVKFILLTTLAVALAAGRGLDRSATSPRPKPWVVLPALALLACAGLAGVWPGVVQRVLGLVVPEASTGSALLVFGTIWPAAMLSSGALALGTGLSLLLGSRWALVAAALAIVDLGIVNVAINPFAPRSFYELRSEMRPLAERMRAEGNWRVYSYGVAYARPLPWSPLMAANDSNAWLYYFDRQSWLPRTHVLDGFEGAYEVDRTGWAPPGSSLTVFETSPGRFAEVADRLGRASVGFVLSFDPLPEPLVSEVARASFPEIGVPLRLYALRHRRPRAFWIETELAARVPDPPEVRLQRISPHALDIQVRSPPGWVVVTDGFHPAWKIRESGQIVALRRFEERYWIFPTPGGERRFQARFEPDWTKPSAGLVSAGLLVLAGLAVSARARRRDAAPEA